MKVIKDIIVIAPTIVILIYMYIYIYLFSHIVKFYSVLYS